MSMMPNDPHTLAATSRRQFFKMLAGSPLLALAYPELPANWRRELDAVVAHSRHSAGAAMDTCDSCGQRFTLTPQPSHTQSSQQGAAAGPANEALDSHFTGQLIEDAADAINVWDFERVAYANTLPNHWNYLHLGVDDLETRVANREGFQRIGLKPRRLGPDATLDTSVTLFGRRWDTPLFLCPVAALEAYHTEGEAGAARAARARGVLQIQSHQSSQSYERIAEARGEPHWFQLYANSDWDITRKTLDKVKALGCPVLVWTVDLLGGSNRELVRRSQGREAYDRPLCQSCHNHQKGYQRPMHRDVSGPPGPRPPFDWDYVKRLRDATQMKVILKGIVTREEAELCVTHGVDAVFVSNHGGRAENSLRGTIDCLPDVVAGTRGRIPVMIDSGVRRGADMFKALALGADAVGIGRPYVWGLGAFGQDGVDRVIRLMLDEFRMVMRQTRASTIDQIGPQSVAPGQLPIMMRHNARGFGL